DELSDKTSVFQKNQEFIDNSEDLKKQVQTTIKTAEVEIDELTKENKLLEKVGEEKIKLENDKKSLSDNANKLNALKLNVDSLKKAEAEYKQAIEIYNEKQDIAEKKEAEFKAQNKLYLDAQAGILADTLKKDEACPVCGSTTHPIPAIKPENAPTKEQLDILQKESEIATNNANNSRIKAGNLKGVLDEKQNSVMTEIEELLGDVTLKDCAAVITVNLSDIDSKINEHNKLIKVVQNKIERKEQIEKLLPQRTEKLKDLKENLTKISDDVKTKEAENKSLEKRIKELKAKLTFDSKEKAEAEIKALTEKVEQMTKSYETALNDLKDSSEKLASLKAANEEILKRIGDDNDIDLEKETEKLTALDEEFSELERQAKVIHSRINTNKSALNNIKLKSDDLIKAEKKFAWVNSITNTAIGKINGKDKIMLETYIQMQYFERIINRANTRLMIMTDGQYDLVRRKDGASKSGQSGLDLDVIDHYNGSQRSVRSLSGGESFKASLALALGLSDEIQASAGGIKLDTMFVDEGFGSLDEDSLAAAMKALSSLAEDNRLVGIISHVGELKQQIDKQIIVTKDKSGGSKAEIIV
ncbi:MAG: SMC family ATPase, partial [Clostridia bacterium]|nr:SMC family ATPase [Clostridia bacterium]